MEGTRVHRVKLDVLTRGQFGWVVTFVLAVLALACITGAVGPEHTVSRPPSATHGTGVELLSTQCNSDVLNTVIAPVDRCWHHWFQFNKKWTQFFDWEMAVNRPASQATFAADYVLQPHLLWMGSKKSAADSTAADYEIIANDTVTRHVSCGAGQTACSSVILFRTNVVEYETYFFQINLPEKVDGVAVDASFVSTVDFEFLFRNASYAQFELGFKCVFLLLTVVICGMYFLATRGVRSVNRTDHGQGMSWMKALLVTLLLFNNPLFPLAITTPSVLLVWLSTVFQITFVCGLLLFLLVEFAMLTADNPGAQAFGRGFYAPKFLFVGSYWAVAVGMYSWIVFKQQEDPLFDWFEDDQTQSTVKVMGAIMAGVYIMVLAYLVIRSSIMTMCKAHQTLADKVIYTAHMLVLAITLGGVAFGVVYGVDVRHAFDFLFFHAVFNVYVYLLAFLYLPLEEAGFATLDGERAGLAGTGTELPRRTSRRPSTESPRFEIGSPFTDDEDDGLDVEAGFWRPPPKQVDAGVITPIMDSPATVGPPVAYGSASPSPTAATTEVAVDGGDDTVVEIDLVAYGTSAANTPVDEVALEALVAEAEEEEAAGTEAEPEDAVMLGSTNPFDDAAIVAAVLPELKLEEEAHTESPVPPVASGVSPVEASLLDEPVATEPDVGDLLFGIASGSAPEPVSTDVLSPTTATRHAEVDDMFGMPAMSPAASSLLSGDGDVGVDSEVADAFGNL